MKATKELLTIDGVVNLLLGILLMWYPMFLAQALGMTTEYKPFFALESGYSPGRPQFLRALRSDSWCRQVE